MNTVDDSDDDDDEDDDDLFFLPKFLLIISILKLCHIWPIYFANNSLTCLVYAAIDPA